MWDGAPSHRGKEVAALQLRRVPLPAYAPELNPAERIFEEIQARVEGVVYDTLEAKQTVAEAYLRDLSRDPDRVNTCAVGPGSPTPSALCLHTPSNHVPHPYSQLV